MSSRRNWRLASLVVWAVVAKRDRYLSSDSNSCTKRVCVRLSASAASQWGIAKRRAEKTIKASDVMIACRPASIPFWMLVPRDYALTIGYCSCSDLDSDTRFFREHFIEVRDGEDVVFTGNVCPGR
jgi:hypothetical protein